MTAKWIKCTLTEGGKTIRVNMALAATFVPHGAGTRIWIPGDQIGIDVTEMPEQIDAAIARGRWWTPLRPRGERRADDGGARFRADTRSTPSPK